MNLLTKSSAKISKTSDDNWNNVVLYLEPDREMCPGMTDGCYEGCLRKSGRMAMSGSVSARIKRTELLKLQPMVFMSQLKVEISSALKSAKRKGKGLAARMNGTSDKDWSPIYRAFPEVQFYEYTKVYSRVLRGVYDGIDNLHVTVSRSEKMKDETLLAIIDKGYQVAVVFDVKRHDPLPDTYLGIKVIDGDAHDRRFEDDEGVIIGLRLKGDNATKQAARDSGFAVAV